MLYLGHLLGKFYPSAEMQSVYFTAQGDKEFKSNDMFASLNNDYAIGGNYSLII